MYLSRYSSLQLIGIFQVCFGKLCSPVLPITSLRGGGIKFWLLDSRKPIEIKWSSKNYFKNSLIALEMHGLPTSTRISQKLRSGICCLFFFRRHWNKLPRVECWVGLFNHTVKIWRLCMFLIGLQSSKSDVASSWYRQMWDALGNKFFTCWRSASCFYSWATYDGLQCMVYSIEEVREWGCEFVEGRV